MKNFPFLLPRALVLSGALLSSVAFAQQDVGTTLQFKQVQFPQGGPQYGWGGPGRRQFRGEGGRGPRGPRMQGMGHGRNGRPMPLPHPQDVLRGEAQFLERIALSPTAKLHVSLVGRVAGAEYLPLATGIFPAKNGITPFELKIPQGMAPAGPYRLQAWIVVDNRLMFQGRNPVTTVDSFDKPAKIMLKIVSAPQNIGGIGDGKKLPEPPKVAGIEGVMPMIALVKGQITKLDRRGIAPDAEVEVTVADVSKADAPADVLAQHKFSLAGKQLPFNFELPVRVDKAKMKPNGRYTISAKVYEGGKLTYITDTSTSINAQNADKPFELKVTRVFVNPVR